MPFARPRFTAILLGLGFAALIAPAQGQPVYRLVGSDGRVTFSDRAPPEVAPASGALPSSAQPAAGSPLGALPFELRQVASRFPVTLYTSAECGPCASGKAMLAGRGVPFTERTVTTAEDSEALRRLAGDGSLPLLTVGAQQLKGYSDAEWTQFLDAAGYPRTSQLPANFRNPAPAPLVAVQRSGAPGAQPESAKPAGSAETGRRPARSPAPPPTAASPSNPAGIRF